MADNLPTGPSGEPPKRRRIAAEGDSDDDGDDQGQQQRQGGAGQAANDDAADAADEAMEEVEDEEARRRRRLEALSADRRRRRLQREAAELREASFPGDEFYAGEKMQEIPDPEVLHDPATDAEPGRAGGRDNDDGLDDFVADDGDDGDAYSSDGDYVEDA
eukprot:CAMPEP_0172543454 /NCGR_PEP_ID=MMETSP1067-20121228/13852_1 /TAXON_ID=265564 ORGANISM="Thalassiosira punctigera, Strain Tpunct2005C2" /NCGR_SAMPLE_ID=MMETSP1067 /ASSEMBLY_ACC=CAM_ASM_000444 /LENGTH=160 /DNA_ID=CAMNT_0013329877 /DNA_START=77 /DNA_END=555 /DNA_ORIENTATION=-